LEQLRNWEPLLEPDLAQALAETGWDELRLMGKYMLKHILRGLVTCIFREKF
jgi:hypothetical protein